MMVDEEGHLRIKGKMKPIITPYLCPLKSMTHGGCPGLSVGDLALVVDGSGPRCEWSLGRVLHVETAKGGLVRSAKVRVRGTELHRPITELVALELSSAVSPSSVTE